jgi:hypothetical protein
MATTSVPELVVLAGGCSVPLPALELLWRLESAGFDVLVDDTGHVLVGPVQRLTLGSARPSLFIGTTCGCWLTTAAKASSERRDSPAHHPCQ